jgi:predicted nucleotidyltransferase
MAKDFDKLRGMIEKVARALGDELLAEVAFVGGCTTGLLISDRVTLDGVRATDDVDLIVNVVGYSGWSDFQNRLLKKGFSTSMEDEIICRLRLGDLKVDFMPDDEKILGFSNRWYQQALANTQNYQLTDDLIIRLLSPPYFIATKLEAYKGRGENDLLASRDIEDILNIVDGRPELINDLKATDPQVRNYIAEEIAALLKDEMIDYAVQCMVVGGAARQQVVFNRLEAFEALSGT